jgi:hypothetical protein
MYSSSLRQTLASSLVILSPFHKDPDPDPDRDPDPDHDHDPDPGPDRDHDRDHDHDPDRDHDRDPDPDHDRDPDRDHDPDHDLYFCFKPLISVSRMIQWQQSAHTNHAGVSVRLSNFFHQIPPFHTQWRHL